MTTEIELKIQMPNARLEEFLSSIRTFEQTDPEHIHMAIALNQPKMEANDAMELFRRLKMPEIQIVLPQTKGTVTQ